MLRFCEPGDGYSTAWVDGGLSRCFLDVVGSISCAGIVFIVGLTGIVLGPKVSESMGITSPLIHCKLTLRGGVENALLTLETICHIKGVMHNDIASALTCVVVQCATSSIVSLDFSVTSAHLARVLNGNGM